VVVPAGTRWATFTMADAAPYLIKIDDTKRRDDIGGVKNLVRTSQPASPG